MLVEGALATPSADVEHFPSQAIPNTAKQFIRLTATAAATSHNWRGTTWNYGAFRRCYMQNVARNSLLEDVELRTSLRGVIATIEQYQTPTERRKAKGHRSTARPCCRNS